MKLFIFQYDNGVDYNETHWAEADSEELARVKLKGFGNYGEKQLNNEFKLVAIFPLAEPQSPATAKETGKDWIINAANEIVEWVIPCKENFARKWEQQRKNDIHKIIRKHEAIK